jgi:Ni/Co efflux regulator RcnB
MTINSAKKKAGFMAIAVLGLVTMFGLSQTSASAATNDEHGRDGDRYQQRDRDRDRRDRDDRYRGDRDDRYRDHDRRDRDDRWRNERRGVIFRFGF